MTDNNSTATADNADSPVIDAPASRPLRPPMRAALSRISTRTRERIEQGIARGLTAGAIAEQLGVGLDVVRVVWRAMEGLAGEIPGRPSADEIARRDAALPRDAESPLEAPADRRGVRDDNRRERIAAARAEARAYYGTPLHDWRL